MPSQSITLAGHLEPELEGAYVHLPFDVPHGALRLEVEFHYDRRISADPRESGGNTVDLGVFDQRGITFLRAGFRGWSGSERDNFFIAEDEATPGYLAGPLAAGRWHLLLGLYKMSPDGCNYQAKVTLTTGVERAQGAVPPIHRSDLPADPPPAPDSPWLRGELHCHTFHSDGSLSPEELLALARERGMDFIAVTDHNTTSAQAALAKIARPGLVLLRGVESTTFKGHFNVWGIPDWIDFRVQSPQQMADAIHYANDLGGLTSCNHPKPIGPNWDFPEVTNYACVEVWNGPWNGLNEISLNYWVSLLAKGRRLPAVGGSDYHKPGEQAGGRERNIGTPTNWVYVPGEPSSENILEAIRSGHVSLANTPDGPRLDLRVGPLPGVLPGDAVQAPASGRVEVAVRCERGEGHIFRLLDQTGERYSAEVKAADQTFSAQLDVAGSLYIRAELRTSEEWLCALTNPVYFS